MYRKVEDAPSQPEDFELPFEGKLSQNNRWVVMADLIPWDEFEACIRQELFEGNGGTRTAI